MYIYICIYLYVYIYKAGLKIGSEQVTKSNSLLAPMYIHIYIYVYIYIYTSTSDDDDVYLNKMSWS
jgi:hypothetical protein